MTLPYHQITLDPAELFFGSGRAALFWSPDRTIFATWGLAGARGSEGFLDDLSIWDNATRTRAEFYTGFAGNADDDLDANDFEPVCLLSDGSVYGVLAASPQTFAKLNKMALTGAAVASAPGDIQNPPIVPFACPDGHERIVVLPNSPPGGLHAAWLYRPDNDSWEQFTHDLSAYSLSGFQLAPLQDQYGDLWGYNANSTGTAVFWRFKAFGDNPDTINAVQTVTGLTGGEGAATFTTDGAIIANGESGGVNKYLFRIGGIDTNSWSIVQTKDFGDNYLFFPIGFEVSFAPYKPSDLWLWVADYRSDPMGTNRFATEIQVSDLAELQTADLDDWITAPPDLESLHPLSTVDYETPALIPTYYDGSHLNGSLSWRYWPLPDGGGDGTTDTDVRLRVWGYSLDGHDFYVLRVGPSETLVYDLTTGQWAEWQSPGRTNWRAHTGQNWIGMSQDTLVRGFGSDVVAGDDATGVLWVLDPTIGRDDRSDSGSDYFPRVVTGGITLDGREVAACGAVTLSLSLGAPSQTGATINLLTSDDMGQTWIDHGANTIAAADYSAVVEWRALGQMKAPGRVFSFEDNGAATRISAAALR